MNENTEEKEKESETKKKSCKCKCFISFGEVNKKWLLYPLIIIIVVFKSSYEYYEKENNFYFKLFIDFLSLFLNGVIIAIYLIKDKILGKKNYLFGDELIYNKIKKKEGNCLSAKQEIENSTNNENLNKKLEEKKWLFISSLVYVIFHIFNSYIRTTKVYKNRGGSLISLPFLFRIITMILLSNKLIKYIKIYRHHYVSIIAIIILILIINLTGFIIGDNHNFKGFIIFFIKDIFFSVNCVFGAVYLNKSKGNALLLCFTTSIFLFISIILFHIMNLIIHDCKEDNSEFCQNSELRNFYDDFDKFKEAKTYLYILLIYLKEIINWYIIYFFSPNHYVAISSIETFYITLITIHDHFNGFYVYLISYLLIVFFLMVYNEMIILKFCGLEKNTKVEIYERVKEDNNNSILNDEEENEKIEIENYQIDMEDKSF